MTQVKSCQEPEFWKLTDMLIYDLGGLHPSKREMVREAARSLFRLGRIDGLREAEGYVLDQEEHCNGLDHLLMFASQQLIGVEERITASIAKLEKEPQQ